jgi:hypothetical protein
MDIPQKLRLFESSLYTETPIVYESEGSGVLDRTRLEELGVWLAGQVEQSRLHAGVFESVLLPAILYGEGVRTGFQYTPETTIIEGVDRMRARHKAFLCVVEPLAKAVGANYRFEMQPEKRGEDYSGKLGIVAGESLPEDSEKRGEFLRYPSCCVDNFVSGERPEGPYQSNFDGQTLEEVEGFLEENPDLHYQLFRACGEDCEEAAVQRREYRDLVVSNYPGIAERFEPLLRRDFIADIAEYRRE